MKLKKLRLWDRHAISAFRKQAKAEKHSQVGISLDNIVRTGIYMVYSQTQYSD